MKGGLIISATILFMNAHAQFDLQGHRGCRGLMPENTIPAMIHALELGVSTLEMDVVMTADNVVILSHEPWMNPDICRDAAGKELSDDRENYSIFRLTCDEVRSFDCGSPEYDRFPEQKKLSVYKPSLAEVLDTVIAYCRSNELALPYLNIETKITPQGDGVYHPQPEVLVEAIASVVNGTPFENKMFLQSFDPRSLEVAHKEHPSWKLVLLIEKERNPEKALKMLSFKPDVYSPNFELLDKETVKYLHERSIRVIPWTVNYLPDAEVMLEMGVDGIITDYPDRISIEALGIE